MAIREKVVEGRKVFEVSIGLRSKVRPELRAQKMRRNITSLREAQLVEKELIRDCSKELAYLEGAGIPWSELLERFELAHRREEPGLKKLQKNYLVETMAMLRQFTNEWMKKNCQDVTAGDVRKVFRDMEEKGYSKSRMRAVKSGINSVYTWGIEEGSVGGVRMSPAFSVQLQKTKDEKPPLILTMPEIVKLLSAAKSLDHQWYPVWFAALNTGMRSGELFALEWGDVDLDRRTITVSKSYNNRMDVVKSTKAGYWRNVPINSGLLELLAKLKSEAGPEAKHVLPRVSRWSNGEAAKFLREFCSSIGITPVSFHALRACFATHLLNSGVGQGVVKKICGWTDEKVMTRYIRLAGVDVAGATERLGFTNEKPLKTDLEEMSFTKV